MTLLAAAPIWAADSVFVQGAFNGRWGASFPPFIPQVIGPINFSQMGEAEGIAGMDGLRGSGTAARLCPPSGEKREFYGGDYDYNKLGEFYACTNGTRLFGVYRDFDGSDFGSIQINETFPGENPNWTGTFTNASNDTGAMHGVYQGGGIAFSNPRMSLKWAKAEKGRLQGEDLLSERIEGFERGGGQGGGGSCAHSCRDHEGFLELPLPPPLNVESGAVRPR